MQSKLMENFASTTTLNARQPDLQQQEEAFKKILEEENRRRDELMAKQREEDEKNNPLAGLFSPQKGSLKDKFANALRQSLQVSGLKKDYDIRQNSYLNAMRKLFEELRTAGELGALNGEDLFSTDIRNHDGSVHKDEFVYRLLNVE